MTAENNNTESSTNFNTRNRESQPSKLKTNHKRQIKYLNNVSEYIT